MSLKLRSMEDARQAHRGWGKSGAVAGEPLCPSVSAAELLVVCSSLICGSSTVNQECPSVGELVGQVTNRLPHPLWSVNPPL